MPGRACNGERPWAVPGFVTKQDKPAAATASIGDVLGSIGRADALVRGFLAVLMRQQRSRATALDYVLALGRDVRANCRISRNEPGMTGGASFPGPAGELPLVMGGRPGIAARPGPGRPGRGARDEIGPGPAVDETTDLKRGKATACVSPQHPGVTGRAGNCVTRVFAALVTASAQAWAWFGLYMPEGTRAKDQQRRKKAGIPGCRDDEPAR